MAHTDTAHGDHGHEQGHGEAHAEHHIIPPKTYYAVFAWLMILLIITLGAAMKDMGPLNFPIAMAIAVAKAVIIMLFFMHLKFNSKLVQTFAITGILWLGILFWLTMNDYVSRPHVLQLR